MKIHHSIIIICSLLLTWAPCSAQEKSKAEIFTVVKNNFEKMYPGAEIKEWEKGTIVFMDNNYVRSSRPLTLKMNSPINIKLDKLAEDNKYSVLKNFLIVRRFASLA